MSSYKDILERLNLIVHKIDYLRMFHLLEDASVLSYFEFIGSAPPPSPGAGTFLRLSAFYFATMSFHNPNVMH